MWFHWVLIGVFNLAMNFPHVFNKACGLPYMETYIIIITLSIGPTMNNRWFWPKYKGHFKRWSACHTKDNAVITIFDIWDVGILVELCYHWCQCMLLKTLNIHIIFHQLEDPLVKALQNRRSPTMVEDFEVA